MNSLELADEIIDLYVKYGDSNYIGEKISQSAHMIQAAMFAEEYNKDDIEMILAAFFHDIGQFVEIFNKEKQKGNLGVIDHEIVGKNYLLSKGFSSRIANLVGNHVKAKRYLVTEFPDYYDKLSEASKQTLKFQNGYMTKEEVIEFKNDSLFEDSLKIRGWDDMAKREDVEMKPIEYYKKIIINYLDKIQLKKI